MGFDEWYEGGGGSLVHSKADPKLIAEIIWNVATNQQMKRECQNMKGLVDSIIIPKTEEEQ